MFKPATLALALVSAVALSGCPKQEHSDQPAADANVTAAAPAPAKLKLDESTLPPANHFAITDLDTSKNACADFGGYVNGKWLASNEIPGDRSSWGAFDMLAERSLAVHHQLAEQAARRYAGQGRRKDRRRLLRHRHGRGQGRRAGHRAAAEPPGRDRRADRQGLDRRVPAHFGGQGRKLSVRIRPGSGLQEFVDEHRLRDPRAASACRIAATTSTRTSRTSSPPTRRTSPRCSNCPACPRPTPTSRPRT